MDSFNSYPHLRNIEAHIDQVMTDAGRILPTARRVSLRPVEIYVLLASILFHDLGRAMEDKIGTPHPVLSVRGILSDYGMLGIPNVELARCIAAVSLAHDPPPDWTSNMLYDVVIDPYGEVRQRLLSALLILGDHMDDATNRARPYYIEKPSGLDTKGLFRRAVRGVYADCEFHNVRVVLADMMPWRERQRHASLHSFPVVRYRFPETPSNIEHLKIPGGMLARIKLHYLAEEATAIQSKRDCICGYPAGVKRTQTKRSTPRQEAAWLLKILKRVVHSPLKKAKDPSRDAFRFLLQNHEVTPVPLGIWHFLAPNDLQLIPKAVPAWVRKDARVLFEKLSTLDWLVAFGCLNVRLEKEAPTDVPRAGSNDWPHPSLLAVLMHQVDENQKALAIIGNDLRGAHISLRAWLLEHREHLYTRFGAETYEPAFRTDFLIRIAEAMWELSLRVFGSSRFSYAELASQARESNVALVHRGVRRLSIVERCEFYRTRAASNFPSKHKNAVDKLSASQRSMDSTEAIWSGEAEWRWVIRDALWHRCTTCEFAGPSCWRMRLRKRADKFPQPGLQHIQELIKHLQSPLI